MVNRVTHVVGAFVGPRRLFVAHCVLRVHNSVRLYAGVQEAPGLGCPPPEGALPEGGVAVSPPGPAPVPPAVIEARKSSSSCHGETSVNNVKLGSFDIETRIENIRVLSFNEPHVVHDR